METIRKLLSHLREYRRAATLAPVCTLCCVVLEVLVPFIMGLLIDRGISQGDLQQVMQWGAIMIVCAIVALIMGYLSGVYGSEASVGLAANLRDDLFEKVQTYSFKNIDKFSTAGLVTRMTTDVTNVQNAFQMALIIATRAPITLVVSMAMCIFLSPSMSLIFVVAMLALGIGLFSIMFKVMPLFRRVFEHYDQLNSSVQENVTAIRVVKAFVREDHENEKFEASANKLRDMFVAAESLLAFNNPIMMCAIYGCVIALSWFGTKAIVAGNLTTGELTSLLGYIMNILMSLMMLTMIFVMITMSAASANRIIEVLEEVPDIVSPEDAITFVIPTGGASYLAASPTNVTEGATAHFVKTGGGDLTVTGDVGGITGVVDVLAGRLTFNKMFADDADVTINIAEGAFVGCDVAGGAASILKFILKDSAGHTGIGEIHGGDYTHDGLVAMKPLVVGTPVSECRKVLQKKACRRKRKRRLSRIKAKDLPVGGRMAGRISSRRKKPSTRTGISSKEEFSWLVRSGQKWTMRRI
jgi:ATP-binding cassette subfamily B protein